MAVKRKYRLNLRNYGNLPAIMLSQYDEGYALEFEIRDGTDAASDLSAYTVTLKGTRADTLAYSFAGTVSTNVLTFVIDTTMTACDGRGTAEIAIKDTANDVLFATFNMPVFVERAAVPEGSIDADVERAQEIAEQVQEIVDNAAAAVSGEAERWATGQINGTDVPSTDPTYENNAKYYAEQAADSAASIGIDATLTQAGKAADAKKTGDEISELKEGLSSAENVLYFDENVSVWTEWEKGMVNLYANPWTYVSTNGALRNKKGRDIYLNVGTIVGLTDYNTYAYYIGARREDGTQIWSSGTWLNADVTLSRDGYYGIMVHRKDGANLSDADISTIKDLVFINHIDSRNDLKISVFKGYLLSDGNINANTDSFVVTTNLISVNSGEKYVIAESVPSGSIEIHYCFYSDARTFISPRHTYTTTKCIDRGGNKVGFDEITVPTNAKYMRVSFYAYENGYYHIFKTQDANGNRISSSFDIFKNAIQDEQDVIVLNKQKHNISAKIILDMYTTPVLFNTFANTMVIPAGAIIIANKQAYVVSSATTLDLALNTHNSTVLIVLYNISTHTFRVIPYTSYQSINESEYIVCSMRWYPYSSDRIKINLSCPWILNGMMYGITKPNPCVSAVAHRGLSYTAPENTIIAFQLAKIWGFDYVETDIMFTSDNVPVLLHDPTINRTARNSDGTELSSTVNIADITYSQAQSYDFGIYKESAFTGTKIPTLDEFMLSCKRLGLKPILELKTDANLTQAKIEAIMAIVDKYGMRACTGWTSFSSEYLSIVKSLDDSAILMYTTNEALSSATIEVCNGLKTGKNRIVFGTMQANGISASDAALLASNVIEGQLPLSDNPTTIVQSNMYGTWQFSNGVIVGNVLAGYELQGMTY